MVINRQSTNAFLITAFIIVCALMPAQSFGMKELFLVLLIIINVDVIFTGFANYKSVLLYGFVLPIWLLIISIISGGDVINSIRAVYIFTFIWIAVIALHFRVNLKKIFLDVTFIIAIITDALVFFQATGIYPLLSNPLALWMNEVGNAQLSYGDVAIFYYVFFLNAAPLMLFTLVDSLQNKNLTRAIVVFAALLCSGTRANIYLAFVCVAAYVIVYMRNDWKKVLIISIGCLVAIYAVIQLAPIIADKIETINYVKTQGDSLRSSRTSEAIRIIFGNAKTFWFGMGSNVPFKANGEYNYSSEMSYVEVWRIYGIISFILIISLLVFLVWKNRKDPNVIACVAYLAICAVDPFLMTSTGFLMVMYMFYLYLRQSVNETEMVFSKKFAMRTKTPKMKCTMRILKG